MEGLIQSLCTLLNIIPEFLWNSLNKKMVTILYLLRKYLPKTPVQGQGVCISHPKTKKVQQLHMTQGSNIYCSQGLLMGVGGVTGAAPFTPERGSLQGHLGWGQCLASPLLLWVRSSPPSGSFPGLPECHLCLLVQDEGGSRS